MSNIEGIVRPFQTRDITPPRRVLTAYEKSPEKLTLEFGRSGGGKTMNGSYSVTQSNYMDTKLRESPDPLAV